MDDPSVLLDKLRTNVEKWATLSRRAQLQAAMPILEALSKSGVEYANLARLLGEVGVEIRTDTLRQAMHRWRKSIVQEDSVASQSNVGYEPSTTQFSSQPFNDSSMLRNITSEITPQPGNPEKMPLTKAELREIRNKHIDLDEINRQARKLREQPQK